MVHFSKGGGAPYWTPSPPPLDPLTHTLPAQILATTKQGYKPWARGGGVPTLAEIKIKATPPLLTPVPTTTLGIIILRPRKFVDFPLP